MIHVCRRCDQPVDYSDAADLRDIAAILLAHLALDCTGGGQGVDKAVGGSERINP